MQAVELNLASRPFRNNLPIWLAYACGALLVAGMSFWNVVTFRDYGDRLERLREQMASVERKLDALEAREQRARREIEGFDLKVLAAQSRRANGVIRRRALSWTELFNLLERIQPYEVRLSSVRPLYGTRGEQSGEPRDDRFVPVSVEGTAQNLRAFADYEWALLNDRHFTQIEPQRATIGSGGEVYFDLRFLYAPEGVEKAAPAGPPQPAEEPLGAPPVSTTGAAAEEARSEEFHREASPPEETDVAAPAPSESPTAPQPQRAAAPPASRPRPGAIQTEPTPEEIERAKHWKPALEPEPPGSVRERVPGKGPRKGRP